jgi:HK97 family phage prohead protease
MTDTEIRTADLGVFELREAHSGPGTLVGYAAVFNRQSQNLGGFVEQVDPGAFTRTLGMSELRVAARYNHDDNFLLGTTEGGTLTLSVDGTGLRYEVDLPDTTAGRDVAALARRGDLRYSSFAFRTLEDDWSETEAGFPLRTLRAVQLVDVAPVNNPAYLDTSVAVRSLEARAAVVVVPDLGESGPSETHPLSLFQRRLTLLSK